MIKQHKQIYDFKANEQKWRPYWQEIDLYKTGDDTDKPDIYILDFFPYPSGDGLSVGHCRNYIPTCVSSRFYRMNGYNVLHPMGWDAFGLPAENYAIFHGIHPHESSAQFCATYKHQMQLVECSYDWSREFSSTDPDYYRWTQYFFLLLHERGLAYRTFGSQWWCPQCHTVLANEQVENGRCWRCAAEVTKKELEQWFFKITDYADRLIADLDTVDWPEPIKTMQRNWVGRSEGVEINFTVSQEIKIPVFTSRPDTLFGVSYIAVAPEHPLVAKLTIPEQATAVQAYIHQTQNQADTARMAADKEKTGVFSGSYASHPLNAEPIPIWIADYVLMGYGSGAIMGVPAHDTRDFAFAQQHKLPIVPVIQSDADKLTDCYTGHGTLINSDVYSGVPSQKGSVQITTALETLGKGCQQVSYRMRDWLISRQRYWGAPIPIIHCPACGSVPVPLEDLPVKLPETIDFAPADDGRSPLARCTEWVNTTCPECGGAAERETDTMDGFACSSWYFLRFANPTYQNGPFDPEAVQRWLPVDTYVGGAEHAVMHLLYARFWTKVMYDAGLITFKEPFTQLRNQGILHAADGSRMSKSRGNVITPDEVIHRYGTDALRVFVLFIGPFDGDVTWQEDGIKGIVRFLERYWRVAGDGHSRDKGTENMGFERQRHQVIKKVTADMLQLRFNTAVATLMGYMRYLESMTTENVAAHQWRRAIETFTLLLSPFAPFLTEEVWQTTLGHTTSVHQQSWPTYDEALAADEEVTIILQVNGKLRDRLVVAAGSDEEWLLETAVANPKIQHYIQDKPIQRTVIVPDKLVNIVV